MKIVFTLVLCLVCSMLQAQIKFKGIIHSDIPQVIQAEHGDTIGYCTPKNGRFIIKNIDQPLKITLIPSGKEIYLDGTDQPKHTIKMDIFLKK